MLEHSARSLPEETTLLWFADLVPLSALRAIQADVFC